VTDGDQEYVPSLTTALDNQALRLPTVAIKRHGLSLVDWICFPYPALVAEASGSDPIQPVYSYGAPGEPIELYSGPIAVDSGDRLRGRIYADLAGDLQVRWTVTDSPQWFNFGYVSLTLEPQGIGLVAVPALLGNRAGAGTITYATLGDDEALCDRMILHFTNLPQMGTSNRWQGSGAGWDLTLEPRTDHREIFRTLQKSVFFAVTHIGELRRTDGSTFKAGEGAEALEAWKVALAFALGYWVAPVAPVGLDAVGKPVWEQWASWRCDSVSTDYLPWWSYLQGGDLRTFTNRFLEAWFKSDQECEVVRFVALLLIAAHHRGVPLEAKIILSHSALDYLSWATYVLTGKRTQRQHQKARKLRGKDIPEATWHMKELLRTARISAQIPQQLVDLRKFARREGQPSGPGAVSRLRNSFVHPKGAAETDRVETGLVFQAWQLITEYAELVLLHRIGYDGKYLPRTDMYSINSVPVPWAS
jgi:hypothetical protein